MNKYKYIFMLVSTINVNQIITKNTAKEIPPIYLEISESTIQEYLLDTTEEKNKNDNRTKNKKQAYVLNRIKTFFVVCKHYVDLQYELLKEYIFHTLDALKNI